MKELLEELFYGALISTLYILDIIFFSNIVIYFTNIKSSFSPYITIASIILSIYVSITVTKTFFRFNNKEKK